MADLGSESESRNKRLKPVKLEDVDHNGEAEACQEAGREKSAILKEAGREKSTILKEEVKDDDAYEYAKPVGKPIRSSGEGRTRRSQAFEHNGHKNKKPISCSDEGRMWRTLYNAFQHMGREYKLEDTVLLIPQIPAGAVSKPYVATIKNIAQTRTGEIMVKVQWFYRPEEINKPEGGTWQAHDHRELFYSFHQDEVPAESIMHKCIVHLIPTRKQYPSRGQSRGFIAHQVYDIAENKILELTDEICRLIAL